MSNNIYCTYLTIYKGNKLPPFYIGYSTINKIQKGYHGSVSSKKYSKIWKEELQKNPHLFKTKILSIYKSKEDALSRESFLQTNMNVLNNELYINESIVKSKKFYTNFHQGMKGKKHSEEWKIAQSNRAKKLNSDPTIKKRLSESKIGKNNPMYGISPSNKGKKFYNDGVRNFYLDPNDPITAHYTPGLFPNPKRKGRIPWNKK